MKCLPVLVVLMMMVTNDGQVYGELDQIIEMLMLLIMLHDLDVNKAHV